MLIVRCAVSDLPTVQTLEAAGAFLADTLLYFEVSTVNVPQMTPIEGISIRVATETDAAEIEAVAAACFKDYQGHYHADPRLDRAACDALYVDWAVRSVTVAGVAEVVLVAERIMAAGHTRLVGFTTLRAADASTYDIGLTAVHPQYQGQGINRVQLKQAQAWSSAMGGKKLTISTQVGNIPSQRLPCAPDLCRAAPSTPYIGGYDALGSSRRTAMFGLVGGTSSGLMPCSAS